MHVKVVRMHQYSLAHPCINLSALVALALVTLALVDTLAYPCIGILLLTLECIGVYSY